MDSTTVAALWNPRVVPMTMASISPMAQPVKQCKVSGAGRARCYINLGAKTRQLTPPPMAMSRSVDAWFPACPGQGTST
jgi:hypothetical protein